VQENSPLEKASQVKNLNKIRDNSNCHKFSQRNFILFINHSSYYKERNHQYIDELFSTKKKGQILELTLLINS